MLPYDILSLFTLIMLPVFYFIDLLITCYAIRRNYELNVWYYKLSKKSGFIKGIILKTAFCIIVSLLIIDPPIKTAAPILIACIYFANIIQLSIVFMKNRL